MAVSSIGGIGGEKYAGVRLMDVWLDVWVAMVGVVQVVACCGVWSVVASGEIDGCPRSRKRSKNAPLL